VLTARVRSPAFVRSVGKLALVAANTFTQFAARWVCALCMLLCLLRSASLHKGRASVRPPASPLTPTSHLVSPLVRCRVVRAPCALPLRHHCATTVPPLHHAVVPCCRPMLSPLVSPLLPLALLFSWLLLLCVLLCVPHLHLRHAVPRCSGLCQCVRLAHCARQAGAAPAGGRAEGGGRGAGARGFSGVVGYNDGEQQGGSHLRNADFGASQLRFTFYTVDPSWELRSGAPHRWLLRLSDAPRSRSFCSAARFLPFCNLEPGGASASSSESKATPRWGIAPLRSEWGWRHGLSGGSGSGP
jgi:hypothetical protein